MAAKNMMLRTLIILLLLFSPSPAGVAPLFAATWEGKRIDRVEINQNKALPSDSFSQAIGISKGDTYQARIIRKAVERLHQTGKVTSVAVQVTPLSQESVVVTFVIVERRLISDIMFRGHRQFKQKELFDALHFTPGSSFDESQWDSRVPHLIALYKSEGYFNVQMETRFEPVPSDPFKTAVHIHITEGERARIHKLLFTGPRLFSYLSLYLSVRSQKPRYFNARQLEKDIEHLRLFYRKQGYLMATVGPPQVDFLPRRGEVNITIPIAASTKIGLFFHGLGPLGLDPLGLDPLGLTPLGLAPLTGLARYSPIPIPEVESLDRLVQISAENGDTTEVLSASARMIELFYHSKGYPFAKVRVETKSFPKENRKEVHFTIEGLARVRIREIAFSGNNAFPHQRLKKLVRLKEEGLFTKSRFTQEQVQEDTENLTLFYRREGFQSAQVATDIHFDAKKKWAALTFRIDEGVQTRIGTLVIEGGYRGQTPGQAPGLAPGLAPSSAQSFDLLPIHRGDPFHPGVLQDGARHILTTLSQSGYIDAQVDSDVTFTDDKTEANIQYRVDKGKQVFLGALRLSGNQTTRDETLLREILIRQGDPYDYDKILKSQQRLSQTGLFSGIRFDPIRDANNPTIQNLDLTVVERPRLIFELGPGYGERERMRGFMELGHRNLFGTGRKISLHASGSKRERQYSLNYKEPRLLPYDIDTTLGATYFLIPRESFDEKALVGTWGIERQFSRAWKGAIIYQFEDKEISNVKPDVKLTEQDTGRLIIGSINPSLVRDTTDNQFDPKLGTIHSITIKDAAKLLGSKVQMVKIIQRNGFFFSPTPTGTFALSTRIGVAERFGETQLIPISERFFVGGRSTVRGYAHHTLGLEGTTLINGEPAGGNALLILNEEFRLAVSGAFGMVFFFDHGNVWREFDEISFKEIKSTTGIGLRYNTPVGPFRVDWGYKLNREGSEPPHDFYVTLGHAF
jgi:outer membrane protein insertion porin family